MSPTCGLSFPELQGFSQPFPRAEDEPDFLVRVNVCRGPVQGLPKQQDEVVPDDPATLISDLAQEKPHLLRSSEIPYQHLLCPLLVAHEVVFQVSLHLFVCLWISVAF